MTADNNTNARNQKVHIAHIRAIENVSISDIAEIVVALQMAHAEINCAELMTDLCTEVYGAEEDVQAIADVLNNSAYTDRIVKFMCINTEAKEIELDEESRKSITHFRDMLKENADLNGWTDKCTGEYSTADLVRLLIQNGINEYQRGIDYAKAHQEGQ